MCVTAAHPEIENVFMEYLNSGKQFTAYDVTKEVRSRVGQGTRIDHEDVRSFIHGNFQDLDGAIPVDFSRQIVHLSNGAAPYLYFPVTSDPNDYIKSHGGTPVRVAAAGAVPSVDDGLDLDDDDDDTIGLVATVTKENRINVPKKALDQVSSENGSYDIDVDGNIRFALPNDDGRVRVTVSYNAGDKVSVSTDSTRNCIVITKCSV